MTTTIETLIKALQEQNNPTPTPIQADELNADVLKTLNEVFQSFNDKLKADTKPAETPTTETTQDESMIKL